MNLNQRRRDEPEINLTPLIDVVFLMLIFFMVSTTFVNQAQLDVTLPDSSQAASEDEPDALRLTINASGRVFLDGKTLINAKVSTIQRALEGSVGSRTPKNIRLIIRADADARHQVVVSALDAAAKVGLSRVGMAASAADGE